MKLSKNSLHYKIYRKMQTTADGKFTEPTNFCSYFWWYVFGIFCASFLLTVVCFALCTMAYSGYMVVADKTITKENTFGSMGQMFWMVAGLVGFMLAVYTIFTKNNTIKSFIKALIGKYCPKITWE